jgi:hypothetical protein
MLPQRGLSQTLESARPLESRIEITVIKLQSYENRFFLGQIESIVTPRFNRQENLSANKTLLLLKPIQANQS